MNDVAASIRLAHQLRQQSLKMRTYSVHLQIMSSFSICDFVEKGSKWRVKADPRHSISMLWRHLEVIRRHIHKPDHISTDAKEELLALLSQLDIRVRNVVRQYGLVSDPSDEPTEHQACGVAGAKSGNEDRLIEGGLRWRYGRA